MASTTEHATEAAPDEHEHPGPRAYVRIAVALALITAMEVVIYYIKGLRGVLVPSLIFFSVIKFSLVALHFMHLKFDSRVFRRLFITGIVLALGVFAVVLATFGVFKA